MARLCTTDRDGNLLWSSLNSDGTAAAASAIALSASAASGSADSTTSGVLRPSCAISKLIQAQGDTLVVAGEKPHAVCVFEGHSGRQGPPVLRHTMTDFSDDERPLSVALSPDGQSVAIGIGSGECDSCKTNMLNF
jgi:hypothetical protein